MKRLEMKIQIKKVPQSKKEGQERCLSDQT